MNLRILMMPEQELENVIDFLATKPPERGTQSPWEKSLYKGITSRQDLLELGNPESPVSGPIEWSISEASQRRQGVVHLHALGDERFRLRYPLQIDLEVTPDVISACWTEMALYGHGSTRTQALEELRAAIIDTLDDAEEDRNAEDIAPSLRRHYQLVEECVERVGASQG